MKVSTETVRELVLTALSCSLCWEKELMERSVCVMGSDVTVRYTVMIIRNCVKSFSGFPGQEGPGASDGEDICHESPKEGTFSSLESD